MSASTIELLVSCHLLPERTDDDIAAHQEAVAAEEWEDRASKILERIEEIDANRPAGRTQLASMRFLQGSEQDGYAGGQSGRMLCRHSPMPSDRQRLRTGCCGGYNTTVKSLGEV